MPPGNEESKDDVKAAETGSEKIVCPSCGSESGECAGGHEAEPHDGDDGDRVCAAGDDASAVEKKPSGGEGGLEAGALQEESEECTHDQRGEKAESDFASGSGEERKAAAVGLPDHGDGGDESCEEGFGQPDLEPGVRGPGKLLLGEPGGDEGRGAEDDLSPAGDGGEGGGALHGVANEAEVGGGIEGRGGVRHSVVRTAWAAEGSVLARLGHYEDRVA